MRTKTEVSQEILELHRAGSSLYRELQNPKINQDTSKLADLVVRFGENNVKLDHKINELSLIMEQERVNNP